MMAVDRKKDGGGAYNNTEKRRSIVKRGRLVVDPMVRTMVGRETDNKAGRLGRKRINRRTVARGVGTINLVPKSLIIIFFLNYAKRIEIRIQEDNHFCPKIV